MDESPDLATALDQVAEDIRKKNPEMPEFEAAFSAVRSNLTVIATMMATAGMIHGQLDERTLLALTDALVKTCYWMAAKEMAAQTLRDIDNGMV